MTPNNLGQQIFNESDVFDLLMSGHCYTKLSGMIVDSSVDTSQLPDWVTELEWIPAHTHDHDPQQFHQQCQQHWHMPREYQDCDIAQVVLDLCATDEELQRAGHELMLYQERGLFDLLKYLRYLVDTMRKNSIIWGVGRGSSVSSYVLYLLGVHRVNSIYYDLDPAEFLR
jgi:DNA polymerase III alpha subunit